MGWFKKIISVIVRFSLVGLLVSLLKPSAVKIPALCPAGEDASAEEKARMNQLAQETSEQEKQAKAANGQKLVINGAKIQCTLCSNPIGTLLAANNTPSIQGQPTAIVKDNAKANLIFSGTCMKSPNAAAPCLSVIQPGQWKDAGSYKVQGESPLLLKSTITCMYGGVDIKITDCGQRSSFVYDAPSDMEDELDEKSEMRIALFFDGTRNNMKNTEAREEYFKLIGHKPYENPVWAKSADTVKAGHYKRQGNKKDDSYESGYSNVAFLSQYYIRETNDHENLRDYKYIEGIATGDREHDAYVTDSMSGYMVAMGKSGIAAKVEKGCAFAAEKIKKLNGKNKKLRQLTIDVFGFSRGAAAARSFLNELRQMPQPARVDYVSSPEGSISVVIPALPRYGKLGLELEKRSIDISNCHIIVRFAGLFDTVSSHGLRLNKEEDTKVLGLDAITRAKNILHITSADEHRFFFPLVNIKSAGFKEKTFPGVHSDIGGSYVDNDPETRKALAFGLDSLIMEKYKKVVRDGWYTRTHLEIRKPALPTIKIDLKTFKPSEWIKVNPGKILEVPRLYAHKESISVAYSYIPLHIMCEYAMKEGIRIKFRQTQLKEKCNLDKHSRLHPIQTRLRSIVFDDVPEMTFYTREELTKEIDQIRPGGPPYQYPQKLWDADDPIRLESEAGHPIRIEAFITDPNLIQKIKDHNTLLWLRNEYLHWSADWFDPGFHPTGDGKRTIHAG